MYFKKNYLIYIFILIFFFKNFNVNDNKNYKISTYNVLWLFKDFESIPDLIKKDIISNNFHKSYESKIELLANELKELDSDIFFFQEVQNINVLTDLNKKLNNTYIPLIQVSNLTNKLPLHTACLYKKHIDLQIINNTFTMKFGRLMHVYDSMNNINFINIHLISSKENYPQRLKQLTEIVNYVKNIDRVILLGDFNDIDTDFHYFTPKFFINLNPIWKYFSFNTEISALEPLKSEKRFTNVFKFYPNLNIYTHYKSGKFSENNIVNFNKLQTLDYIFIDNDVMFFNVFVTLLNDLNTNDIVHDKWISDHRAVSASFNFF